jgi:hypothetical protein
MTERKGAGARSPGTFLDAAAAVLRRARRPLTASEITIKATNEGLLRGSVGKSPHRTMSSALYMDVLHSPASRFVRLAQKGPTRALRNSVKWALK